MKKTDKQKMVWQDKKRILGLPISFTKYALTPEKLVISSGFFSNREDELMLYRILDIRMKISFTQRIFNIGNIEVFSKDVSHPLFLIQNIASPKKVRDLLSNLVERRKLEIGVLGREMTGTLD